ncbi:MULTISPECIES: hypothetical protein [unclassified Microcoleus]
MLCARRRSIAVGRRAILYVQQLTAELGQLLRAIARGDCLLGKLIFPCTL